MNVNGLVAEHKFMAWLLEQGYEIAQTMEGGVTDVVWREKPGDYWRSAQVKKVYQKRGKPTVNLVRSKGQRYGAIDADYLAAVDYDNNKLWLIRFDAVCQWTRKTLNQDWDAYINEL